MFILFHFNFVLIVGEEGMRGLQQWAMSQWERNGLLPREISKYTTVIWWQKSGGGHAGGKGLLLKYIIAKHRKQGVVILVTYLPIEIEHSMV